MFPALTPPRGKNCTPRCAYGAAMDLRYGRPPHASAGKNLTKRQPSSIDASSSDGVAIPGANGRPASCKERGDVPPTQDTRAVQYQQDEHTTLRKTLCKSNVNVRGVQRVSIGGECMGCSGSSGSSHANANLRRPDNARVHPRRYTKRSPSLLHSNRLLWCEDGANTKQDSGNVGGDRPHRVHLRRKAQCSDVQQWSEKRPLDLVRGLLALLRGDQSLSESGVGSRCCALKEGERVRTHVCQAPWIRPKAVLSRGQA